MAAPKNMKTVGEMREFLAAMVIGIKDGDLSVEKAARITKMVGQINESIYAEVKALKVRAELQMELKELGDMPIGRDLGVD